jgi:Chaperone of endosialidase
MKPDAPTPPNPYATAAAQTGTNVSTGVANSMLNYVNQNTPDGSLRYDVTGNYDWTDPSTGSKYSIPRFTSTQSLSPQSQAIKAQTDATKMNLAGMSNAQSAKVSNLLGTPFNSNLNAQQYLQNNPDVAAYAQQHGLDPMQYAAQHYQSFGQGEGRAGGSPTGGDASGIAGVDQALTGYQSGGPIQGTFGEAGDITRSYGPADNFSADRSRVEESLMSRINPQLARERGNIEQRLADQGIRYGSQAYTSAMDDYNRQATDTRFGAISQAGQEQQRMMDMAAKQAGFENSAQQQAYDQALGRGSFYNAAQAAQTSQNAAAAGFTNAGLAQQMAQQQSIFNARNSQRNQYMQEQYAQRNQPLNEISALMAGSQVQSPNWLNSPQSQIATTDIGGLINQNFSQQQQNYQTAQSAWNATMGGLLGLGAGMMKSDRRSKDVGPKMATVFAAGHDGEPKELPIYSYKYKDDPSGAKHVGPMAQDVEKIDKGAVTTRGGVKHIYPAKVMGSILRAA